MSEWQSIDKDETIIKLNQELEQNKRMLDSAILALSEIAMICGADENEFALHSVKGLVADCEELKCAVIDWWESCERNESEEPEFVTLARDLLDGSES